MVLLKNTDLIRLLNGSFHGWGWYIPLAFSVTAGNTNEQITLTPLEEKILNDFKLSKFIVCTDAGLASNANRKFNDKNDRAFITTQSIKKLKSI